MKKNKLRLIANILTYSLIFSSIQMPAYANESDTSEVFELTEEETASSDNISSETSTDIDIETTEADSVSEEAGSSEELSTTEEADTTEEATSTEETDTEVATDYSQALKAFKELASDNILMALIYKADSVDIFASIDTDELSNKLVYGDRLASLESGYTVYAHEVKILQDRPYYYVSFYVDGEEIFGYIDGYNLAHSSEEWAEWEDKYIKASEDLTLEAYDDIEKFPGFMQEKLIALKRKHPNWLFVPQNTNLDFDSAVSNEMGDKSWIWINDSNRNAGFLGNKTAQANWCYATEKAVKYYLNPYNYLDETHIFAFEQLTYNASYHTEAGIQSFLNNTFMKGTIPGEGMTYAHAFYEIGKSRKLSPTHLAARVYQEQGAGTSPLISGKYPGYEGYYNYFNSGATGKTTTDVIVNGLKTAKSAGWNTRYKSLAGGAARIGNGYILKGQDTIYLEKFNVAPGATNATYTHQYMQNIQAPFTESESTYKSYSEASSLNSGFVFKIPIYNNMPSAGNVPINEIAISNAAEAENMLTGQTFNLDLEYWPKDTTEDISPVWTSSNPSIVSVENGSLKALKAGKANISVTLGSKKLTSPLSVTVKDCKVTIYKADGKNVAKTISASYGQLLTAADLDIINSLGQTDSNAVFEGFYSAIDGGSLYKEGSAIYEENVSLFPRYTYKGRGFMISSVADQTYTGLAIKPEVSVYDSYSYTTEDNEDGYYHEPLKKGVDYTITYRNNKLVGRADNEKVSARPAIIITGKGNYTGSQTIYFNIVEKSLNDKDIQADNLLLAYTGRSILGKPVVYRDGKKLALNRDYTLSYPAGVTNYSKPGNWPIKITGKGGYKGSLTIYETITSDVLMSKVTVRAIPAQTYDGTKKTPEVIVTYNNRALIKSTDNGKSGEYELIYGDNTEIGTGTVTIKAVNKSGFSGSKTVSFKINGTPISRVKIRAKSGSSALSPTGIDNKTFSDNKADMQQNPDNYELYIGDKILDPANDYDVSYLNNDRVGTASIIFTGKKAYLGTLKKNYRILPCELPNIKNLGQLKVYMPADEVLGDLVLASTDSIERNGISYYEDGVISYAYRKGGVKPEPLLIYNGRELTNKVEYSLAYARSNTLNDGSNPAKLPQLTINGKTSFKGKLTINFTIASRKLVKNGQASLTMTAPDIAYNVKKNGFKSVPVLTDVNGLKLTKNIDYDKNFIYSYAEDTDLDGDGIIDKIGNDEIQATDILPVGTKVRVSLKGRGNYSDDTISCVYRIVSMPISSASIKASISPKTYTGRQIKPTKEDIVLKIKGIPLSPEDYKIVSYGENIKKGSGSLVIEGTHNYGGSRTIKFNIVSKLFSWL